MPQAIRGGHDTHWRVMGQGAEPAVMIHCSLAHSGAWSGVAERLDDLLAMRAFDMVGHGLSADWDGTGDYAEAVANVGRDFLTDSNRPQHLIAHSFGAVTALRLACEMPERIATLTLVEPVLFTVARVDAPDATPEGVSNTSTFREALDKGDLVTAAREFHAKWGDGRAWDEMSERQRDGLARRMPMIAAVQLTNNGDPGDIVSSGAIERLPMPTLLVEGGDSPPHIAIINGGLARRIRDSRRLVVEGAGHMAPITHPDPVAEAIRTLVTEARVPASSG
ncbi:hypothetical protein ATO6_13840 [Oceanicola sp. 22II-s10i]|uniref:alpha/beta fold hydrolase n=1 Tax=Oceanicola sp. 22II-s10i TaxID=1317116 RepID=UPI000B523E8B|nr:alpha/beta hydrolase [Oceanicola sp. 22II-s10i]OWU84139.1 hypothetical protein ATO6_13840 [Oceanicola sp. 22II-s10i]